MPVLISVDWDFFVYNPADAGERFSKNLNTGGDVCNGMIYDWTFSERQSPMLQSILWLSRCAGIYNIGRDPELDVCMRADKPGVTPSKFVHELMRYTDRPEDAPLYVSDSHAHGLTVAQIAHFAARRRPLTVLHFDAHHDLGYNGNPEAIKAAEKDGSGDCGTWLYACLVAGLVDRIRVVYPDWKGTRESEEVDMPHLKKFRRKIKFLTWSDWLADEADKALAYGQVKATHLCRSSAWTPPWEDARFNELWCIMPCSNDHCMDCDALLPKIGGHNACKPRVWDAEAARAYAAAQRDAVEACHAGRSQEEAVGRVNAAWTALGMEEPFDKKAVQ